MNISDAILTYLNENKHTCDAETMVNNIHTMVLRWQQEQQQFMNNHFSTPTTENPALPQTIHNSSSLLPSRTAADMLVALPSQQPPLASPTTNQTATTESLWMMNGNQPTPPLSTLHQPPITAANNQSLHGSAYNTHHNTTRQQQGCSSNTAPHEQQQSVMKISSTATAHPQSLKSSSVTKPSHMTTEAQTINSSSGNIATNHHHTNTISSQDITLFIKPARKTAKYFLMYIPPKLYCSPYKYDLMLRVPTHINDSYDFIFTLRDAETGEKITKNNKGVEAYCIERTKTQRKNYLKPGFSNATFRLNFSVCSFHNGRKPFILTIHLRSKSLMHCMMNTGGEMEDDQLLLTSEPFSIFARKAGTRGQSTDDDWGVVAQQGGGDSSEPHVGSSTEDEEVKTPKKKKVPSSLTKRKRGSDHDEARSEQRMTLTTKSSKKTKRSSSKVEITHTENSHASSSSSSSTSSASSYSDDHQANHDHHPLANFNTQQLTTVNIATEFDQLSEPPSSQQPQQEVQNNTSFNNLFETDQWSHLFENSALSPDIAPFLEEEIVSCQKQPQPQSAIYEQFGRDSMIQEQQQPAVDLTMALYQELLKQFNRNTSQLPSFIAQPKPETNQKIWSQQIQQPQYQQQTLQNTTTVDPLDLGRLLRNNNNVSLSTNVQPSHNTNNNLLLTIDESLYTKLFGNNYNPNHYFFNN